MMCHFWRCNCARWQFLVDCGFYMSHVFSHTAHYWCCSWPPFSESRLCMAIRVTLRGSTQLWFSCYIHTALHTTSLYYVVTWFSFSSYLSSVCVGRFGVVADGHRGQNHRIVVIGMIRKPGRSGSHVFNHNWLSILIDELRLLLLQLEV